MSEVEAAGGKEGQGGCESATAEPVDAEAGAAAEAAAAPPVGVPPPLCSWYSRFLSFSSSVLMRLSTYSILGGPSLSDSATEEGWTGEGLRVWDRGGRGVSGAQRGRGGSGVSEEGAERLGVSSPVTLASPAESSDSEYCAGICWCRACCCGTCCRGNSDCGACCCEES